MSYCEPNFHGFGSIYGNNRQYNHDQLYGYDDKYSYATNHIFVDINSRAACDQQMPITQSLYTYIYQNYYGGQYVYGQAANVSYNSYDQTISGLYANNNYNNQDGYNQTTHRQHNNN